MENYRVTALTLNVRKNPSLDSDVINLRADKWRKYMNNKLNNVGKFILIGICLMLGVINTYSQTLTNSDMKNLVLVKGYTGVGTFPAIAIAIPKDMVIEDKRVANKVYLLTASATGWTKKEITCVRGISMSNDGKIWLATSDLAGPNEGCVHAYRISFSNNGGKMWKSSTGGFNPSNSSKFLFLNINAQGNGQLVMWVAINEGSIDTIRNPEFYLPRVSNFYQINSGNLANGESVSTSPTQSQNNIAQININNFSSNNADTLESNKLWLAKLAKTKKAKRSEFPKP